jgi:ABC-2 type transport system ATP-binding protein
VLEIRSMLRDLGGEHTLVFSSHILAEVEMLCDRVVILSEGKVVADETLREALRAAVVHGRFVASRRQAHRVVSRALQRLGPDAVVEPTVETEDGGTAAVSVALPEEHAGRLEDLLRCLGEVALEERVPVVSLSPGQTRLEERFAEVTGARREG